MQHGKPRLSGKMDRVCGEMEQVTEEVHWIDEGLPSGEALGTELDGECEMRTRGIVEVEDEGVGHGFESAAG